MPVPLTWLLLHFGHIPSCPLVGLMPFGTLWVGTAPAMPSSTSDVPGPLPWRRQQLPLGWWVCSSCEERGQRQLGQGCARACPGHGDRAFIRASIAAGETEARWVWGDLPSVCHPLLWPHPCLLLPPCSPVPHCPPSQPRCSPRQRCGGRDGEGPGTVLLWEMAQDHLIPNCVRWAPGYVGTGGWRAAAALRPGRCPHPARACAPSLGHEAAGPLSPALCLAICSPSGGSARPTPAVPQSQGLEPLRGSGCGPDTSGKEDVAGIANGQQPPEPVAKAAERAGARAGL